MAPSLRARSSNTKNLSTPNNHNTAVGEESPVKKRKRVNKKNVKNTQTNDVAPSPPAKPSSVVSQSPPQKEKQASTKGKKGRTSKKSRISDDVDDETSAQEKGSFASKKKKDPPHQILTERDELPKLWDAPKALQNGSHTFRICSWNVAGLRAMLKKSPDALPELVAKHDVDVLCLQEIKLQEVHLDDPKLAIRGHLLEEQGYDGYYSCSTSKKGYSGTAVFVRRRKGTSSKNAQKQTTMDKFFAKTSSRENEGESKTKKESLPTGVEAESLMPREVSYKMGKEKHDSEGRLVILDFPWFTLCNVYVPNSGQKLERLSYRTDEWDKDLLAFMQQKQKDRGLPVLWLGDLNVAHTNLEVWNDGAKHLPKQAGVTPEERASFQEQLDAGFVDAFRKLHPTAKGHYSYWSQRAGNREPNKGLRLDYFICDPSFFDESSRVIVRDSYMIFDQHGSDHCPVVLELEMKPPM